MSSETAALAHNESLHSSTNEGQVELAKPLRQETEKLMRKITQLYPLSEENGWLVARAPVDSDIVHGAPQSSAYTFIEVKTLPPEDEGASTNYFELVYFEETIYDNDPPEREDLLTMTFSPGSLFVDLDVHDPAVRKRYPNLRTVDNHLGIEINADLKDTCSYLTASELGSTALSDIAA